MWLPKSAGKSVDSFVADAVSNLDKFDFEKNVREFIGSSLSNRLVADDFQVLFEISDEYLRTYSAIGTMAKEKLVVDCRKREKVMAETERRLTDLHGYVKTQSTDLLRPLTNLLVQSVSAQLAKLQRTLDIEFAALRNQQRLSEGMIRALQLKNLRPSFVARLNSYVGDVALKLNLKQKDADKIVAAAMAAAGVFTKAERETGDLEERIPMARSRAQAHIRREILDRGEFPVFPSAPKRKTL